MGAMDYSRSNLIILATLPESIFIFLVELARLRVVQQLQADPIHLRVDAFLDLLECLDQLIAFVLQTK